MPEFTDILYEKQDHIATIAINRPQVLNAFTNHTMREMSLAIHDCTEDRSVGVVVITGVGERAFSAGGDVKWEQQGGEKAMWDLFPEIHNAIRCCLKPVIARVNGYCIGGANHLAYHCDLTIAAEHAIFGQNGPRVGSPADGHFVNVLAHQVGHKRAREIWYLCRRYTARQMLDWGLVNAVVPLAELDAEVDKWCQELLDKSPSCLAVLKASFEKDLEHLWAPAFSVQRMLFPNYMNGPEQLEGTTAFLEKRPPNFRQFRQ